MKTKITLLILAAGFLVSYAWAQPNDKQDANEKMEAAKVGIITTNLNLTPEEAQKFWPVYNEYEAKQKELRKTIKELKSREMKSDADYEKVIDDMLKNRQAEVDLEKEYKDKFLKVISARQLVELYKAEREFKMMLLHKLEGRQPPHGPGGRGPGPGPKGPHPNEF